MITRPSYRCRHSHGRRRAVIIAATTAAVSLFACGGGASTAEAGLVVQVEATGGSAGVTLTDSRNVSVSQVGDVVSLAVFAQISGTNGVNDETAKFQFGSFASAGATLGNMAGGVVSPFDGTSFQNGSVQDIDSDGDLDLGSAGSTGGGKFFARSLSPTALDVVVDANTAKVQIGQLTFTVTALGAGVTDVNFIPRTDATGGNLAAAALWSQDSEFISYNPTTGTFAAGAPVHITAVPEPATLGLLSLASVGLLKRRRRQPAQPPRSS